MNIEFTTQDAEAMFLKWLEGSDSPLLLDHYQTIFEHSQKRLPDEVCEAHDFPIGTTFGQAARSIIELVDQIEKRHRLANRIEFGSEEKSLTWWQNNRDSPDRVKLRFVGDEWELEIAPIEGPMK